MEHYPDYPASGYTPTIFISIIGTCIERRHIAVAFARRKALDGLIAYLNFIMDDRVLAPDASENDIFAAIRDNLDAEAEVIECDL